MLTSGPRPTMPLRRRKRFGWIAALSGGLVVAIVLLFMIILPAPAQRADIASFDITSKINGQTYRLKVSTPPQPAPPKGYPVLYVLDGHWYFDAFARAALKEINAKTVVPFIVVGITYPVDDPAELGKRRDYDLTLPVAGPNPYSGPRGGADAFLQVLDKELKPGVAANYTVDASSQVLYGHSYGGLTALRELFRNPGAFSAYILSSPAIWWENKLVLADEAAFSQQVRQGRIRARILVSSADGEKEIEVNRAGVAISMLDDASELASRLTALQAQALPVSRVIIAGSTHLSAPSRSTDQVIRFAIRAP